MPLVYRFKTLVLLSITVVAVFLLSACEKIFPPSPYDCENLPEAYQNLPEDNRYHFVLWRDAGMSQAAFDELLFNKLTPTILAIDSDSIRYWVTDPSIESLTLRQKPRDDGALLAAIVSVKTDSKEDATRLYQWLSEQVHFASAYQVQHSLPLDYQRDWPVGEASPGIVSVSLFKRKEGLDAKGFKDYWHCSHTPFALEIHPLWRYERNVVVKALSADAPVYEGIVPLHMQKDEDLTDFSNFFAADGNWAIYNAMRIQSDVSNFIDLDHIEATAMREYVMR